MGSNTETTMVEYDKIWEFVEEKFKTPVPPYFKNILKVCGYNNGVTIASIVEDDFQYFVDEVRNGSVVKYFEGKIEEKNIFEGSTKTMKDFEFTRGHQKFLISIALFLKKYLDENGPDSISKWSETESNKKSVKIKKKKSVRKIQKKIKFTSVDLLKKSSPVTNAAHQENPNAKSQPLIQDLKAQKIKLQNKVVTSLSTHTSEMYMKDFEMINQKIACDLIEVDEISQSKDQQDKSVDLTVEDSMKYTAKVSCPFCPQKIRVFHVPNENGILRWNSSNFDRHLKKCHKTEIPEEPATSKTDETSEIGFEMIKIDKIKKKSDEKLGTTSKVDEAFWTGVETVIIDEVTAKSDEKLATTSKVDEAFWTVVETVIIDEVTAKSDEKLATTSKVDEAFWTVVEPVIIDEVTAKSDEKLATTSKVDEAFWTGVETVIIDEVTAKYDEKLATTSKVDEAFWTGVETVIIDEVTAKYDEKLATTSIADKTSETGIEMIKTDGMMATFVEKLASTSNAEIHTKTHIDEMSKPYIDASIMSKTDVKYFQTIKIDEGMKKYVHKPVTITSRPVSHNKIVSYSDSDSDSDSNEEDKENDKSKAISSDDGSFTNAKQAPKRKKVPKQAPKPTTKRNKFDNLSSIRKYTKFKKNQSSQSNQSVDQKKHLEKSWKKYF